MQSLIVNRPDISNSQMGVDANLKPTASLKELTTRLQNILQHTVPTPNDENFKNDEWLQIAECVSSWAIYIPWISKLEVIMLDPTLMLFSCKVYTLCRGSLSTGYNQMAMAQEILESESTRVTTFQT